MGKLTTPMRKGILSALISATLVGVIASSAVIYSYLMPQKVKYLINASQKFSLGELAGFGFDDNEASNAEIVNTANQAVVTVIAVRAIKPPVEEPVSGGESSNPGIQTENPIQKGTGTGFLIDSEGYVVTNEHVIKDADRIRVKLADGKECKVSVVGVDIPTDLALLKIEGENLPVLSFGDSDEMRVGDPVIAIGNPLEYEHSVTAGIISAKDRKVYNAKPYESYIQTDASINRGNSGGPLLNKKGEVIGVNTVIRVDSRGISFAIPSNVAKLVVARLRTYGVVPRGYLGVTPTNITDEMREGLDLGNVQGVLVTDVDPGFSASKAGIKQYDVITSFDGQDIKRTEDFFAVVSDTLPNKTVNLTIIRSGNLMKVSAVLERRTDDPTPTRPEATPTLQKTGFDLGFSVRPNASNTDVPVLIKDQAGMVQGGGVVVTKVDPLGPAGGSQLKSGHVITEVNRKPIRNYNDFQSLVSQLRPGNALVLRVSAPDIKGMHLVAIRVGEI